MGGDKKSGGANSPAPPPFSGTPPSQAAGIRSATEADVDGLVGLIAELNQDEGNPTDRLTAEALHRLIGEAFVFVADIEGTLVGYATGHPTYETGYAEPGIYVGDLYVTPAHRRQGIARALLSHMARAGHARGARHLWLTARDDNHAAHAFYRRLGSRGERVMAFAVVEQDFRNLAAEARS